MWLFYGFTPMKHFIPFDKTCIFLGYYIRNSTSFNVSEYIHKNIWWFFKIPYLWGVTDLYIEMWPQQKSQNPGYAIGPTPVTLTLSFTIFLTLYEATRDAILLSVIRGLVAILGWSEGIWNNNLHEMTTQDCTQKKLHVTELSNLY